MELLNAINTLDMNDTIGLDDTFDMNNTNTTDGPDYNKVYTHRQIVIILIVCMFFAPLLLCICYKCSICCSDFK